MSSQNAQSNLPSIDTLSNRQRRIFTFLTEQRTAVLSTVTPENKPHGTVVYYTITPDFVLHFITKKGTQKYHNMLHSPDVMFTVFSARTQTTAQIEGRAVEIDDRDHLNQLATALFGKAHAESGLPPIMKLQAGTFTSFQITPAQIRIARYSRPQAGSHHELFESIESFDLDGHTA